MGSSFHRNLFSGVLVDTRRQSDGDAGGGAPGHVTVHVRHAGLVLTILLTVLALVWLWASDSTHMSVNILAIIWICYAPLLGYALLGGE